MNWSSLPNQGELIRASVVTSSYVPSMIYFCISLLGLCSVSYWWWWCTWQLPGPARVSAPSGPSRV